MKKLLKGTIVLLALLLCVSANAMSATAQVSDDPMVVLVLSLRDQGNDTIYSVASANDVYSLAGDVKYTLLTLSPYGYVVILNEGNVPLEYSLAQPTGGSGPVNPTDSQMYYAGPGNYYVKDANNNIISNFGVVENEQIESAIEWESNVIESLQLDEYYLDSCNNYATRQIEEETYIAHHNYFRTLSKIPDNDDGSCGAIAACMLFGYYRYYFDNRFVANNHIDGNGTNNAFKDYMYALMLNGNDYIGTTIREQVDGASAYLAEKFIITCLKPVLHLVGSSTYSTLFPMMDIDELVDNIECQISIDRPLSLGTLSHQQIAYGIKTYTDGSADILTHQGYKDNFWNMWGKFGSNYQVWLNSSVVIDTFAIKYEESHTRNPSSPCYCKNCSVLIGHSWDAIDTHKCKSCYYVEPHNYTFFNNSGHIVSCYKCGYGSGTLEGHNYEVYLEGGFIWKRCINCYYRYNTGNSINSPNITASW